MQQGICKLKPDRRDYHFLPSFGVTSYDLQGLPSTFSIYDGRVIPNQMGFDTRFNPPIPPMPFGCTGESGTFACGLEDSKVYNPRYLYKNTAPYDDGGRDMRVMLAALKSGMLMDANGNLGPKRLAYFNVYGSGPIDDFDAARLAIWLGQVEKRATLAATWWYPEFSATITDGFVPAPASYDMSRATLHSWIATGWKDDNYLEIIWWNSVKGYMHRDIYNKLMKQPWTGCFTVTKEAANAPIPVGMQAVVDHMWYALISFIRKIYTK